MGARDASGAAIISDNTLGFLPPIQIKKKSTKYKGMYGSELCIIVSKFQASLNAYWLFLLQRLENEADKYELPRDKRIKKTRSDNYL